MRWILVPIVLLSAYASDVVACSCIRESDDQRTAVETAFKKADLVFVGRIESKERFSLEEYDTEIEYERTQFYVVESWKGEKAARVYIESSVTCCLCGYEFPRTGSFLVYAYGPDANGYYSTSNCSRTKELKAADAEIAILNEISAGEGRTKRSSRSREERAPAER